MPWRTSSSGFEMRERQRLACVPDRRPPIASSVALLCLPAAGGAGRLCELSKGTPEGEGQAGLTTPWRGPETPRHGGAPPARPPEREQSAPFEGGGEAAGPARNGRGPLPNPGGPKAATDNHARDRNQAARAAQQTAPDLTRGRDLRTGPRRSAAATPAAAGRSAGPGRTPNEPRRRPRSGAEHGATATGAAPPDLTRGRDGGPRRGLYR